MKRWVLLVVLLWTLQIVLTAPAAAKVAVTVSELTEDAGKFDGKHVWIRGEAIGQPMPRGSHTWLNISDGNNAAIGVWARDSQVERIRFWGSYLQKGDTVAVEGVFHRTCSEHGGDTDIHSEKITLIGKGGHKAHPIQQTRAIAALATLGLSGFLLKMHEYIRKRSPIAP